MPVILAVRAGTGEKWAFWICFAEIQEQDVPIAAGPGWNRNSVAPKKDSCAEARHTRDHRADRPGPAEMSAYAERK